MTKRKGTVLGNGESLHRTLLVLAE